MMASKLFTGLISVDLRQAPITSCHSNNVTREDDTCRRGPEKSSLSRELLLLSHHPLIHYYLRASTLPHSLTQTSCSCNSKLGRRRSRLKGSNVCYECIDFCYYSAAAAAVFLTSIVIGTPNFAHSCELTTKWNSD